MFEIAELGQKLSREEFDRVAGDLRVELLALQERLREADFPVIILFGGVDGAGKSETVNLINEWLDAHWIVTRAYEDPTQEERERPHFWRYWRDLPPKGRIGLFLSGWYSQPILRRVYKKIGNAAFDYRLDHIASFEKTLADDGALILKFWMHLGRKPQKRRLQALAKDPLQSWRAGEKDWQNWKRYDRFIDAAERAIRRTDTGQCRWTIVDGSNARHRSLTVLNALKESLRLHLDRRGSKAKPKKEKPGAAEKLTVLSHLDLGLTLPREDYVQALREGKAELALLAHEARRRSIATVALFEGWDAAGKGGAIRRITSAIDARSWQVVSISAPTEEERAQHYLWRFWRHLPRDGRMTIFDRSWYGRVLVERVEGFADIAEWRRAYAEINNFEDQLLHHGMALAKFWLHISPEEQYRRFQERDATLYKKWKLTDEDWRNRSKWGGYELAVHEMVERTGTARAPWNLIEANDKNFARIKILGTLAGVLRRRLEDS